MEKLPEKKTETEEPASTDTEENFSTKNVLQLVFMNLKSRKSWFIGIGSLLAVGFFGGIIGGIIGILAINDYFSLTSDRGRQYVLEESSAIIGVAEKLAPSVVNIRTETDVVNIFGQVLSVREGAGTGIIVSESGLILTNKHVIDETVDRIEVILQDGRKLENVRVLSRDPFIDVAYLEVKGESNLKVAELGDSDQVVVGQKVIAIGNALGEFANTVTTGIISGIGRPVIAGSSSDAERLQDLLQTDAAINPGNSGGPLVDIEGRVIGVNTAVAGGAENIGFAIPINQVKAGIESIQETGRLSKPYIGVRYVHITPEFAQSNDLPVSSGAYISGGQGQPAILPKSPAAKAGLKEKDIITKINGEEISKGRSLITLISKHRAGDAIVVTVIRTEKEIEIRVVLEELPR
jgi:serine protease Do